jgi:enoyl-CoA hydratase
MIMDEILLDAPVLIGLENGIGRITLNRPKALHALTTQMCALMSEALKAWEKDDRVQMVMVEHAAGSRGFCAGGDIRMVAESARGDGKAADTFFATEYRLNTQIKRFPKPYLSFMDGVTMGGGVGISVHGSHRIATENTLFAMPETGIGLFPDVGGSWFLPRLEGELGTWLALTGARLNCADVAAAGIATHMVASSSLMAIKNALLATDLSGDTGDKIDACLAPFAQPVKAPSYFDHIHVLNKCFAKDHVTDICIALKMADDDWATEQTQILSKRSPLSLSVSLEQLRRGRRMISFEDVMRMEYCIARHITRMHDFSEGVRAVIEEKDNRPNWSPKSLSDVRFAQVELMFEQD